MPKPIFDRIQKKRQRVDHATLEVLEGEGTARLAKTFQKGDIVRYTGKWLRNVGLHTGPKNGEVQGTSGSFVSVLWSDASEPVFVHPANIELDPRHKKRAYTYDRRVAIDWKGVAKKLLDQNQGKTQDDLHYRAYLRDVLAGRDTRHLVQKYEGARKARQDLIDEAGKAPR